MAASQQLIQSYAQAGVSLINSSDGSIECKYYERQHREIINMTRLPLLGMCDNEVCTANILNYIDSICKNKMDINAQNGMPFSANQLIVEFSDEFARRGTLYQFGRNTIRASMKKLQNKGYLTKLKSGIGKPNRYMFNIKKFSESYDSFRNFTLDHLCIPCTQEEHPHTQEVQVGISEENTYPSNFEKGTYSSSPTYPNQDRSGGQFEYMEVVSSNTQEGSEYKEGKLEPSMASIASMPKVIDGSNTFPTPSLRSSMSYSENDSASSDKSSLDSEVTTSLPTLLSDGMRVCDLHPSKPAVYEHGTASMDHENSSFPRNTASVVINECARGGGCTVDPAVQVLQVYDRAPRKLRKKYFQKKVSVLAAQYGDQIESLVNEYGLEDCCTAMETFAQDQYWRENGLPLPAFIKQIDRFLPNQEADGQEKVVGVQNRPKIAPRAPQVAKTDIPEPTIEPQRTVPVVTVSAIKRDLKYARMLAARVDEPFDLMAELDSATSERAQYLVSHMRSRFLEVFGREAPTMP